MSEIEIIEQPNVKPEEKIEKASRYKLLNQVREESQVVIHCSFTATYYSDRIRIWKSTFLYPKDARRKSKMVHHENITLYPTWMQVENGKTVVFTLIFTGLPKHCKSFDMIERIPEPGGFEVRNIPRNNSDVYHIDLN